MSLRDQFLKSGLITKQQAKKIHVEKNKQEHLLRKDKSLLQTAEAEKQKEAQALALEFEKQREIDRALNKKRDQMLAQREQMYRARQLMNSNAQNLRSAEELYFFPENNFVRKVYVSAFQRELLARGALCIARAEAHIDDFILLPRETAKILLDICPEKIIVLHSEIENFDELTLDNRKDTDEYST